MNFASNNRNNDTHIPSSPGRPQNPGNTFQIICRYCKKVGHAIEDYRKRTFNNQVRNSKTQRNEEIPAKMGGDSRKYKHAPRSSENDSLRHGYRTINLTCTEEVPGY